jgi:adenine/guanine phosphoribosyltransferase-like PRPP-binding protein
MKDYLRLIDTDTSGPRYDVTPLFADKGFVPVRKGGKLPVDVDRVSFVDYTGQEKALEIRPDAIEEGVRVWVVNK